ncbi:ATP phosphoribosyltransferase [Nocardia sp. NPDC050697]|uniref:ATP phosphoribosyltransferase n=1 Tax=Nocardia sp. NPDC050697 TaxID=3155158 RepID=UPI0033C41A41
MFSEKNKLRLGIPKGSLQESTMAMFERVGLQFKGESRTLWLSSNDPEIVPVLLKPQEIPGYVRSGRLDAGLSGRDWIVEQDVLQHIKVLLELPFSRQTNNPVRWVLAVPEASEIHTIEDLRKVCDYRRNNGEPFTISTELMRISKMWLARQRVDAIAEFSWGATEAKAEYFADAIIEGTETGASLRANHLREIAEVFRSSNQFFVNRRVYKDDEWKRAKLDGLTHLLRSALKAHDYVELHILARKRLDLAAIAGDQGRISHMGGPVDGGMFSTSLTIRKDQVPRVMPAVIAAGASDVWVAPMSIYYSEGADAGLA